MFCKHCEKEIQEGAKFCKYCGREIIAKVKSSPTERKICPFCNEEITFDREKCPYCKHLLIERIPPSQKHVADIPQPHNHVKESIITKLRSFFNKIGNYFGLIRRYLFILLLIIFVVWIFSGEKQTYNEKSSPKTNESIEIEKDYNSLLNGAIIYSLPYYLSGEGELEIDNGTSYDTVVKLIHKFANRSVYTAYIKANNSHKIDKIIDGKYKLLFMHGKDWDGIHQTFLVSKSYSEFRDDFDFITTWEEYTIYEVTLHSVYGGTAETDDISENEFDKYK